MKLKQALAGVAALASFTAAHAQTANTFYVTTGWFRFMPQDTSDPLKIDSAGGTPVNMAIPNTGASVGSSDTLGVSLGYFITDHIATEAELGIPPKFDISGGGILDSFGKVGSARLWSPALLFKYYFNRPEAKFRPYAGIGFTYAWFSNAKITNGAFEQGVLGGPTSVSTDRSWAPVFNLGFNYNFTKHWFAGFSLSYIPINVTATYTTTLNNQLGTVRTAESKIRLNPLVTYLKVGYMF
ncbi:OmpW/AlkL family protein [Paraburkholderia lycopersici]|uniref:Outer membrane protein n=1 Tax=Paraburkholderia lycopersici TaxID=416944 RepID=A0A1G6Y8A1_9BURK|nr:OmpW family outer membrane protein [Paraburkholderia lycopersici]SDD86724.1 outer membrane protein [Paraburkholderia lycopersici]